MTTEDQTGFGPFIQRWTESGASERANKDLFLAELCDVLGLPRPAPSTGDPAKDTYTFERQVAIPEADGRLHLKPIDLYKEGSFILEAKQGSERGSKKIGTARRGTPGWSIAMSDAFGQALGYAKGFDHPPPFILVCDIGYCLDVYAAFDGSWSYRPFPNAQANRLFLPDLGRHAGHLRSIWTDPVSLDPSRQSIRVTREVAAHLAELARTLEADGHQGEVIAKFLMRCFFTMFAEDIGLLPNRLFTDAIEKMWLPNPPSFQAGVRALWKAMNEGGDTMVAGKLLRFNGGLFTEQVALPLSRGQLALLLDAAECEWSDVEPAIFGTLLERALDPRERHALGAHFTPKAYVERLVKPTIEEPLRADFELVQAEVRHLVEADEIEKAKKAVREFHRKLCQIRVLDPACGSGNFLYVTLELFKRLEGEVLALLAGLGETQERLDLDTVTVNPSQFLGIEIKPWAKEIAELVLWIGYLQWHFRTFASAGKQAAVPEPVLQDCKNIECRDAVLDYDAKELLSDDQGQPVTRWDGVTTKTHPVTGEQVPDETATIPVYRYVNPRKTEWPKADFIVGNPPFIGNWRMRTALGDGYTETLRATYPDVPESVDYVMYWWDKAAELVRRGELKRFGLITTNSLTQTFARRVLQRHMDAEPPVSLTFAVPDHPWVDSENGAAVRIAMSVAELGDHPGRLCTVTSETEVGEGAVEVSLRIESGKIHADVTTGADVSSCVPLRSNEGISCPGVKLHGAGFIVTPDEAAGLGLGRTEGIERHIREYRNGKDLTNRPRGVKVIDLFGLSEAEVRDQWPCLFQWVFERVKPERDARKDGSKDSAGYAKLWWLFGKPRQELRRTIDGFSRFIATVETSKHRFFVFLDGDILPDNKLINIALDDAFCLGVLSSRIHVVWALATGGRLGVGNDPVYVKSSCFEKFPFLFCTEDQKKGIRDLGEALDAHRKARQAEHPDLTITGMYNVLKKLRSGEALTAKEKAIHEKGLVSVLKKIHDDLDAAVFDAYGWPHDLTDEQILERLVALNAERAEEEKQGLIRWLRPEYQTKAVKVKGKSTSKQEDLSVDELADEPTDGKAADKQVPRTRSRAGGRAKHARTKSSKARDGSEATASSGTRAPRKPTGEKRPWPKSLPEQIAAVRDLIVGSTEAWTAEAVTRSFVRARATSVEPVLDSLAAVGLVVGYESSGQRMWKASGRL